MKYLILLLPIFALVNEKVDLNCLNYHEEIIYPDFNIGLYIFFVGIFMTMGIIIVLKSKNKALEYLNKAVNII